MISAMAAVPAKLSPAVAWSRRVRRVGGFIQLAFAAFWLFRGGMTIGGTTGTAVTAVGLLIATAVLVYGIRSTSGAQRPSGNDAKRIERSVNIATVIELAASVALPVVVIAVGRADWVLPSIAITIGPLLLWLDHLLDIPRYRLVGWTLTIGPLLLVAAMSGNALAATTGLAAGVLLLATAAAGFHDLAKILPTAAKPAASPGSRA